jgi:hypothetical protein
MRVILILAVFALGAALIVNAIATAQRSHRRRRQFRESPHCRVECILPTWRDHRARRAIVRVFKLRSVAVVADECDGLYCVAVGRTVVAMA